MKTETIEINGTEVELQWGEGQGLGTAVHTVPSDKVNCVISDGEIFEIRGKNTLLDSTTTRPISQAARTIRNAPAQRPSTRSPENLWLTNANTAKTRTCASDAMRNLTPTTRRSKK